MKPPNHSRQPRPSGALCKCAGTQLGLAAFNRWAHMKSLVLLLLGLVAGCSDRSVTSFEPSEVSGMTSGGQKYSGVIYTRRDGDFERYSIVIVAEGRAVTSMATSDTKVHVYLDRADRVEATWGESVAVVGKHSETIPNEADIAATRRSLERTLDAVLLKTSKVPNQAVEATQPRSEVPNDQ